MSRGNSSKQCSNESSRLTEMIFNPFSCIGIKRPGKMTSFNFVRILWYYKVLSLLKHVAVAGKPITEVRIHYVLQRQDKRYFKHERIRKISRRCVMSERPKFYAGKRKKISATNWAGTSLALYLGRSNSRQTIILSGKFNLSV